MCILWPNLRLGYERQFTLFKKLVYVVEKMLLGSQCLAFRNRLFWIIVLLLTIPAVAAQSVVVLGDSLSAGFGIDPRKGWVQLLDDRLKREGYPQTVVNASISGDTTHSGLTRLDRVLNKHRPGVLIVELGGNDGLRGMSTGEIGANLSGIIRKAKRAHARVLLAGMRLPPNYGPAYTNRFRSIYPGLAGNHRVALVPFLLEGVAGVAGMMQTDGIHPTQAAQQRLLDNVWPHLEPLLSVP